MPHTLCTSPSKPSRWAVGAPVEVGACCSAPVLAAPTDSRPCSSSS